VLVRRVVAAETRVVVVVERVSVVGAGGQKEHCRLRMKVMLMMMMMMMMVVLTSEKKKERQLSITSTVSGSISPHRPILIYLFFLIL
jgi:hypothetical protein